MAENNSKMTCPECGDAMNHHADKLLDPVGPSDADHVDPALGGVIEEAHCCPSCGAVASRIATSSSS